MSDISNEVLGLIGGVGNMRMNKSPDKMFYCKIKQDDNTYWWGFLSPHDTEQLVQCPVTVEVDIPTHQALLRGGTIVYYNGELFNSDKYKLDENYDFIPNENYEQELHQQERERLDKLSMTRGDVFEALILAKGLTKPQIRAMIENAELDTMTKALYLNRFDEALDFYRGFPVFDMLGKKLGVTPKQLDDFFETKDYHYLTSITLKINTTPENAVVTINGVETKEFSTPYQPDLQLPVTYSVTCEGYATKEDGIVLTENTTLEVTLEEEQQAMS